MKNFGDVYQRPGRQGRALRHRRAVHLEQEVDLLPATAATGAVARPPSPEQARYHLSEHHGEHFARTVIYDQDTAPLPVSP